MGYRLDEALDGAPYSLQFDSMRFLYGLYLFCLALTAMGAAAKWEDLSPYQEKLSRSQFVERLQERYAAWGQWLPWIEVETNSALIRLGENPKGDIFYRLRFAPENTKTPAQIETNCPLPKQTASSSHPLKGLRIALEAGHVGDKYAKLESREFQLGADAPVREGDLTLQVVRLTAAKLRALGADVFLVRDSSEPLTQARGKDFAIQEIRARAEKVNNNIKPDFLLSVHFDALPWENPAHPELMDGPSKAHLIVSGAYSSAELSTEEARILMLEKLLSGDGEKERLLAQTLGAVVKKNTGLPAARYTSNNALPIPDHPYVWARNLMVTRLYRCPAVLCELYLMNRPLDYARIQAGRYEGTRLFRGKPYINIFEEYAQTLTDAILAHYAPEWRVPQETPASIPPSQSAAGTFAPPQRP